MSSKKTNFCEPCSRVDKTAAAVKFCTECEEAICADCETAHRAIKTLSSHHLVESSISDANAIFSIKKTCSEHTDMMLDFFCVDHDSLCCHACMANNHRTCGQILPLSVASKGVKGSVLLNDTSKELASMCETLKQLIADRKQNKFRTNEQKSLIFKDIDNLKAQLIKRVVDIEEKFKSEVDSTAKELTGKYEADLIICQAKQDVIKATQKQINSITDHGSDGHMFVLLHTMKANIPKQSNELREYITSLDSLQISFTPPNLTTALESLDSLYSLGSILVNSNPCSVSLESPKHKHAQLESTESRFPSKFKYDRKFKVGSGFGLISCIVVTNDNRLVVCVNDGISISSWTEMGEHLQDCNLVGKPWGIAIISDTDEAVVTLPEREAIQFVNITDMTPGELIRVAGKSYGITIINDQILLGGKGKVYFIDRTGQLLKPIDVGNDFLYNLSPGRGETIYCCQGYPKSKFLCINHTGATMFTYSASVCDGPFGLTNDARGNLYVTAWLSKNIHRLSPDGQLSDIIIETKNEPYAVAFNKSETKMFIGSRKGVLIFNCS